MHRPASDGAPTDPETSESADPGVDWMLRYQGGEEGAFDLLVESYAPRVYALVTRLLGPRADREDLVQEVFLRVIRSRERYTPEARFSTWLYRIVFNLCVNETERRRRSLSLESEGETELSWADARAPAPDEGLGRQDRVRAVQAAIAELPARQRMALVLAKYEELPYDEVGRILGASEKAIKSTVHRAWEFLRARLAPFLEGELA